MAKMDTSPELKFLASKLELFSRSIAHEPSRASVMLVFGAPLSGWEKGPLPARRRLVKLERTMEQLSASHISPAEREAIDLELVRLHGFRSLGKTPVAIISQVFKKGKIAGEDEAILVRTFLNNLENEALVGQAKFSRLAELMVAYGD